MSIYNKDGGCGYLSKDEVIRSLADDNEMLHEELYASNHMKMKYMDDCLKVLTDNNRLKSEVDAIRKELATAQYNGIIDTQLKAIDDLKAEVERLDTLCKKLASQHSDISCENIMLRKAGDEVIREWSTGDETKAQNFMKGLSIWNAAKAANICD